MKQATTTSKDAASSNELFGATSLMTFPMSSVAALSAFQFGVMSHAFGLWMEAVADAAQASQRMWTLGVGWDDSACDEEAVHSAPGKASSRTKLAAKTFMADFESAGRDIARATAKMADVVAHEAEEVSAALLPEDFRKPRAIEKPEAPDDLKLISGIGPKLETTLNEIGVWTFAQIAAWTAEEIAWIDDFLRFPGRVGRDRWVPQAEALANGGEEQSAPEKAPE